ncbi:MAG: hypothetical protein OEV52_02905 [Dehalococcoidia bacterium]|nr:hypothetical protein [Dehalococcoidia bacterium]MDH4292091.1 hypothetical protein [Dehalococcoidia bacterium]
MDKNLGAELEVNKVSIKLNPFAAQFLTRTVVGAVSSLRGSENIRGLELYLERGDVKLVVNGNELPLTPFPKEIITNTITGLVSSLKGVGKIDSLKINVKAH